MPRGDRSGPMGMGPRTGRGAGYCAGYDSPGYANPTPQAGMGQGQGGGGRGRGRRRRQRGRGLGFSDGPANWIQPAAEAGTASPPQKDRDEEMQSLRDQAQSLQALLGAINERLERLEKPRDPNAD